MLRRSARKFASSIFLTHKQQLCPNGSSLCARENSIDSTLATRQRPRTVREIEVTFRARRASRSNSQRVLGGRKVRATSFFRCTELFLLLGGPEGCTCCLFLCTARVIVAPDVHTYMRTKVTKVQAEILYILCVSQLYKSAARCWPPVRLARSRQP